MLDIFDILAMRLKSGKAVSGPGERMRDADVQSRLVLF